VGESEIAPTESYIFLKYVITKVKIVGKPTYYHPDSNYGVKLHSSDIYHFNYELFGYYHVT
jgi:hypothetical protein